MLVVLAIAGRHLASGPYYFGGILVAMLLMAHHQYLIRDRSREGCYRAFQGNNWVGLALFAGIALEYQLGTR